MGQSQLDTMEWNKAVYLLLLVGTVLCQDEATEEEANHVTVRTFLGSVKGQQLESQAGTPYFKFLGIPYAQAPVGNLRFKPPRPVQAWGERDALEEPAQCPQKSFFGPDKGTLSGEEDCLYLNIYSPSISVTSNPFALKPVMIWIHGGGFILGSGSMFGEPNRFVDEDVVVVTLNYRLGALGFMSFGNDEVSGNMGLKDQQMAIQWVRNNIRHFGGNPEKITLFGESAGGISVHAQVLSPFNYGLLAGGIAQSGTMLMLSVDNHQEKMAKEVAKNSECPTDLNSNTLECLQEVSVEDLIKNSSQEEEASTEEERKEAFNFLWWPTSDPYASEPFCPMKPLEAMKTGRYNQIPFMSGTIKNDGGLFIPTKNLEDVSNAWEVFGPAATNLDHSPDVAYLSPESIELSNIIKKYYTGDNFGEENLENVMNMYTDSAFLAADQKSVSIMSQGDSPVYNYVLSYEGPQSFKDIFLEEEAKDREIKPTHADDLIYLFDSPLFPLATEEEQNLSKYMVGCWANFAKYGNPTPFRNEGYPNWEPFRLDKKNYMDFKPYPELKHDIAPERMMFWNRLIWAPREATVDHLILLQKAAKIFQYTL